MEMRPEQIERRQRRIARRARVVGWAKILLPLAAVTLIVVIFLFTGRQQGDVADLFTPEELARLGAGLKLENPRLAGLTDDDQPFELTASEALPDGPMANTIAFSDPAGRIELGDRTVEAAADGGMLDRVEQRLELEGAVRVTTSDGWQGETDRITVELDTKRALSDGAVSAKGPNGELEAGSMRVEEGEGGPTIWFENRVRVLFIPAGDE